MSTLYYFALGGTGALSVEPLVHLCAAGLGPATVSVVLIDPDSSNPAVQRAIELIGWYDEARKAFGSPTSGFFGTEITPTAESEIHWSPISKEAGAQGGNTSMATYIASSRMTERMVNSPGGYQEDPELSEAMGKAGLLLELLYSRTQREEKLREGFRGNPAIGALLMRGLRTAGPVRAAQVDQEGQVDKAYFATGSIFGGTGAAGMPVLADILSPARVTGETDAQWNDRSRRFRARLGAAVVTPYFALPDPPPEELEETRLRPRQFDVSS